MKLLKTSLCIVIAALLCLPALCSCGSGAGPVETTAVLTPDTGDATGESTAEDTSPKFPEADYGGTEFTVYMRNSNASHYAGLYIFCPENSVDTVSQQAQIRNDRVEEKYNIKFKFKEASSPQSSMERDIASGHISYDIVLAQRNGLSGLAYAGLLRNFNELDVDYETEWWDANAKEEYGYLGKLYIMPNDVSVANLAGCRLWWFNKAVLENFRLTSPYDYVQKNEWTVDNFLSLVKSVSDPGADGQMGVYGMIKETPEHLLTGVGCFKVEVDENGNLVCKIGTDYAMRAQDLFDKFKAVAEDPSVCLDYNMAAGMDAVNDSKYVDQFYHARGLFSLGHFLFCQTTMNGSLEAFLESEKGIGAVMNPKYNPDQKEYYHQMDANFPIWCMPKDPNADIERLGNVMNYWAHESSGTVMEAYYELTLKTKRASDPMTAEMLDTVKRSIHYYITDIFGADIGSIITAGYNNSVAFAWKALSRKIPTELKKVQEKIEAIPD